MTNSLRKKILLLSANPIQTSRLRLDEEVRAIKQGLRRSQQRDYFSIESVEAVSYRDIRRVILETNPNIVHFSGHGAGEEGLVFEDESGQAKLVSGKALAGLFKLFNSVECVVLNACYSQVQAEVIAQSIPYVVGMNQVIGDQAAIEFAIGFYDAVGAGRDYELAYEFGCNAITLSGISENLTPQLYKNEDVKRERNSTEKSSAQIENNLKAEFKEIMPESQIFISYAWGGESDKIAEALESTFKNKGIKIIRDTTDLAYKGLIREFMKQIGEGKCVIAVISDKYLKSPNCMFELLEVAKNNNFYDRIFPVVLQDARIYNPIDILNYVKYWEDQIARLNEAIKKVEVVANLQGITDSINLYTNIRNEITNLIDIIGNMNSLTVKEHLKADFSDVIIAIEKRLNEDKINPQTPLR